MKWEILNVANLNKYKSCYLIVAIQLYWVELHKIIIGALSELLVFKSIVIALVEELYHLRVHIHIYVLSYALYSSFIKIYIYGSVAPHR